MALLSYVIFLITLILVLEEHVAAGAVCTDDVCYYDFDVSHARTMTYYEYRPTSAAAYNILQVSDACLQVQSNTFRPGDDDPIGTCVEPFETSDEEKTTYTITADGAIRNVITINERFPGPDIEVMEGSTVSLAI